MATNYEWSEERQCMVPVSEHQIEQLSDEPENQAEGFGVENEAILAAKAAIAAAKKELAKAQGKTPGRRGKAPLEFEAIQLGGNVDKVKFETFKTMHPGKSNTELLRLMLDLALGKVD